MTKNKFADLVAATAAAPEPAPVVEATPPAPAPAPVAATLAPVQEATRMLGGRVPNSVFVDLQRRKLDAETALSFRRRVTTEEALEALVRMLRDPAALEAWHAQLVEIRQERRD